MDRPTPTVDEIQDCISSGTYRLTLHAATRITLRHISVKDVESAILSDGAELIETYPTDPRGPSFLMLGFAADASPLHIQCTYPPLIAITPVYEPRSEQWRNWRVRL